MSMIPQETIQRVVSESDIVDVVGSYISLKRAGANYRALCPFHTEKTPSFNVNPARQIYHCFGCGAGGDVIAFVKEYENLAFAEAVQRLADRAGIRIVEAEFDPQQEARSKLRRQLQTLHKKVAEWYHFLLFKKPAAEIARDYLKRRQISMETARRWQLGYAPDDTAPLLDWAAEEKFDHRLLVESGLAMWRDETEPRRGIYARFRNRLMFPIASEFGDVIAFSGRVLSPDQKGGKYVNSPETILFNKSKVFFGLDKSKRAILKAGEAILCEGQMDLIACFENGIENVVAPLGTAFTEQHARVLKRNAEQVVLCFDSDAAGYKAAERAFRQLAQANVLVKVAPLPPGEDPDSLIGKEGAELFHERIENALSFFDYQINHLSAGMNWESLRDRLEFARTVSGNIALVKEKVLQDSLINQVSTRLGVSADDIRGLVAESARELDRQSRSSARAPSSDDEPERPPAFFIRDPTVRILTQILLRNESARKELASRPLPAYLGEIPGTQLLARLWTADFDASSPHSVSACINTLPETFQPLAAELVAEEIPPLDLNMAEACLLKLNRRALRNRQNEIRAGLNNLNLPPAEIQRLTKELLDLSTRLKDIPPPKTTGG